MKHLLMIFIGYISLASCSQKKVSKDIIPLKPMVSLLVDVHLVESYISSFPKVRDTLKLKRMKDSLNQVAADLYAKVYKKHRTTKAQFDKSLLYYSKQLVLLDTIYDQVKMNLDKKEAQLLNQQR